MAGPRLRSCPFHPTRRGVDALALTEDLTLDGKDGPALCWRTLEIRTSLLHAEMNGRAWECACRSDYTVCECCSCWVLNSYASSCRSRLLSQQEEASGTQQAGGCSVIRHFLSNTPLLNVSERLHKPVLFLWFRRETHDLQAVAARLVSFGKRIGLHWASPLVAILRLYCTAQLRLPWHPLNQGRALPAQAEARLDSTGTRTTANGSTSVNRGRRSNLTVAPSCHGLCSTSALATESQFLERRTLGFRYAFQPTRGGKTPRLQPRLVSLSELWTARRRTP